MDLSKIPEPSEGDLQWTREGLSNFYSNYEDPKKDLRVIAHLLRHGSVLAKSRRQFQDEWYSALYADEQAAISFFEKFGGNDER